MLTRMRGWQRRTWQERGKLERVDLYSRATLCVMTWFLMFSWVVSPLAADLGRRGAPALSLGSAVIVAGVLQCALGNRLVRAAFGHYLGRDVLPTRRLLPLATTTLLALLGTVALQAAHAARGTTLALLLLFLPMPLGVVYAVLVPLRTFFVRYLALGAVTVALMAAAGARGQVLAALAVVQVAGALLTLLTVRPCAWTLSVMWEADRAREAQARLAVAEERLRFGRDLHDVLGRNLAVIALKSELAVQLARRGRPAAVDQMTEVQRIAQDSQREVRAVVRGYREVDLETELAGARGVLSAAGILCEVHGESRCAALDAPVQSALGWVVREAATNVLRHGDAQRCTVSLRVSATEVTLTVENDGAGTEPVDTRQDVGGSGLAGLRERLAEVRGTLAARAHGDGRFLLTATVPLDPAPARLPFRTTAAEEYAS